MRFSSQCARTHGDNRKLLHQQLQRDVSRQPTVSTTPPQDRAASLIHGHTTAIWAAAGTGYFRSGQNRSQRLDERQRAIPQLHQRCVAAPKSERFSQRFSGKCHIPLSVWILPPPRHGLSHEDCADSDRRTLLEPVQHFTAGTAHS